MSEPAPPAAESSADYDPAAAGGLADHPLTAARLAKLERLREGGVDPYPAYEPGLHSRSHTAADLHRRFSDLPPDTATGESVRVAGRLMNTRLLGRLLFGVCQDHSGRIQLFADESRLGEEGFAAFRELDHGDWVWVRGEAATTRRGELSVKAEEFVLLAKALRPLPEKWHGLKDKESRFRRREVDWLVNPQAREIAAARSLVIAELRREFAGRGFMEAETPVLQTQPGGALARPFRTRHRALGVDMYLRIATEIHLKLMVAGGFEKVFELGRVFRNEGIDARHNTEFTTLEAYQALADYRDMMTLLEEIIPAAARRVSENHPVFHGEGPDWGVPFRRAPMLDLVGEALGEEITPDTEPSRLAGLAAGAGVETDPGWGFGKLVQEVFDERVRRSLRDPTFVLDHPVDISPLARRHRSRPGLAERFELFVGGDEIADSFTELNDPLEQRRRFAAQARARAAGDEEAHPFDEEFLRGLEAGMPPTGGVGIGVDRLVMVLTGQSQLREVLLFPYVRPQVP